MALDWTNKVDGVDEVKAKDVNDLAHAIQDMEANPAMHPYINSSTGHWMVWNATTEQYEDSGVAASGFVDANVIDSLNSQSATDALSANQGYVLNGILATAQFQINEVKASLTPKNILINGFFQIWQRGESFTTAYNDTYTADGWKTIFGHGDSVTKDGNGLLFTTSIDNAVIRQIVEEYERYKGNKIYLYLAVETTGNYNFYVSDGVGSYTPALLNGINKFEFDVSEFATKLEIGLASVGAVPQTIKINCINASETKGIPKLNKHSVELAKCQRYLLLTGNNEYFDAVPNGFSANIISFCVNTPVTMRIKPIIVGTFKVVDNNGNEISGFTFSVDRFSPNGIQVFATKTAHGLDRTNATLRVYPNSGFSSEL